MLSIWYVVAAINTVGLLVAFLIYRQLKVKDK